MVHNYLINCKLFEAFLEPGQIVCGPNRCTAFFQCPLQRSMDHPVAPGKIFLNQGDSWIILMINCITIFSLHFPCSWQAKFWEPKSLVCGPISSKFQELVTLIWLLGTIHFRRRQIFTIFDPNPPPSAFFYNYPSANLANFWPLPP